MKFTKMASLVTASLMLLTGCGAVSKNFAADSMEMEYFYAETSAAADYAYTNGSTGGMSKSEIYYDAPMEAAPETESVQMKSGENDLTQRKIIKTANLEYETKTYDEFMESLNREITTCGGYIASQSARGGGEYSAMTQRYSYMTVRIPASGYDRFMEKAAQMGSLLYKSENSEDVTMNYVDTESHIRALETEYEALLTILEKAGDLNDVIKLQSRITEVNYQLDTYKSQLRKYDDLIAYCTVHITVNEVFRESPKNVEVLTFGERIAAAMEDTFLDIADDAQDFTVDFLAALPYLMIWAVILAAAVLILRVILKKIRRRYEIRRLEQLCRKAQENT